MKYNDVSIIIQGPISKTTIFAIAKYSELAEVIVSFSCDENIPDYLRQKTNGNIKVVTYKMHDLNDYFQILKYSTICQFYSTKIGTDISEKKYCIKTRSDEFFENMDYFISLVRGKYNSNLFITNDMFFRRFSFFPYHPSDHLFGCNRVLMKRSFEILFEIIINRKFSKYNLADFDRNYLVPEQYLCISVLNAMHEIYGVELNIHSYFAYFKKVSNRDLANYKVCQNTANRHWFNNHNQNDRIDDMRIDYIDNDQRIIKFI